MSPHFPQVLGRTPLSSPVTGTKHQRNLGLGLALCFCQALSSKGLRGREGWGGVGLWRVGAAHDSRISALKLRERCPGRLCKSAMCLGVRAQPWRQGPAYRNGRNAVLDGLLCGAPQGTTTHGTPLIALGPLMAAHCAPLHPLGVFRT